MKKRLLLILVSFCLQTYGANKQPTEHTTSPALSAEATAYLPFIEGLKKGLSNQTVLLQFKLFITTFINESQFDKQTKEKTLQLLAFLDEGLAIDWNAVYVPQKEGHSEQPALIKKAKDWQNKVGPLMMALFQAALTTLDQAQLTSALSFIVKTFIETLQAPLPGVLPSSQTNLPNKHGV